MSTIIRFIITKAVGSKTLFYRHYDTVKTWGVTKADATAYKTYGEAEEDIENFLEPGIYGIDKVILKHQDAAYEKS